MARKNTIYPINKICLYCKDKFTIKTGGNKNQKYCTHPCYAKSLINKKQPKCTKEKRSKSLKGRKRPSFSEKWKNKIRLAAKKRKHTEKTRRKLSEMHKGSKTNFWKGGISKHYKEGYWTLEYRLWRESVFKRDGYICQECGVKSGTGKTIYLTAHHIKSWAKYPELRFDINNGRTLCEGCHKLTDNYKGRGKK